MNQGNFYECIELTCSLQYLNLKMVYSEIETDDGEHQNQTNDRNGIGLWMVFNKAAGFLAGCNTASIEITSSCYV